MKSTNFYMWPTASKTLGDHPRKKGVGKDGPFLSFATRCKCRVTYAYDLNVKQFPLQLYEAGEAAS